MEGELTSLASRILSAARRGDLLEMEKILALGGLTVDCHDDDGNTAIATACAYGNLSMVSRLHSCKNIINFYILGSFSRL